MRWFFSDWSCRLIPLPSAFNFFCFRFLIFHFSLQWTGAVRSNINLYSATCNGWVICKNQCIFICKYNSGLSVTMNFIYWLPCLLLCKVDWCVEVTDPRHGNSNPIRRWYPCSHANVRVMNSQCYVCCCFVKNWFVTQTVGSGVNSNNCG